MGKTIGIWGCAIVEKSSVDGKVNIIDACEMYYSITRVGGMCGLCVLHPRSQPDMPKVMQKMFKSVPDWVGLAHGLRKAQLLQKVHHHNLNRETHL